MSQPVHPAPATPPSLDEVMRFCETIDEMTGAVPSLPWFQGDLERSALVAKSPRGPVLARMRDYRGDPWDNAEMRLITEGVNDLPRAVAMLRGLVGRVRELEGHAKIGMQCPSCAGSGRIRVGYHDVEQFYKDDPEEKS